MPTKIVKQLEKGQSLAEDFETQPIPIGPFVDNIGINIEVKDVSDNTGVFTVEHRIVKDHARRSGWAKLCLSFDPTIQSKDQVFLIYLNQAPIGEIKVVFTVPGGGDGTCDIWFSGRDV